MDKFFIAIFNFLHKRKWLMYTLLIGSLAVFVYFGLQVKFEEDISKLLPQTDKATESGLAFGNLRVKDKIFVQMTSRDTAVAPEELALVCDQFITRLSEKDTATQYIANVLYRLTDDDVMNAVPFVESELPTFIDTTCYAAFDTLLTQEAIDAQMAKNAEIFANDEEGTISMFVSEDPVGLRHALLAEGKSLKGSLGGFKLIERHFFSPDSTVVLAFLSPNFKSFDSKSGAHLVEMLEQTIAEFEQENAQVEILFHGAPVQGAFNSRQTKKDLLMTMSVSLLLVCLVIGLCFKNKSTLLMLLAPVVYGAFFALACMFWIKGSMSLLAIGIGAIVLGVALSYSLHVLTHYKYVADPIRVLHDQSTPVCLGCLTTIGAFAGLLFTQSELLKDFGLFASLALIGTTLSALIFMPHFFKPEGNERSERAFSVLNKINSLPLDRQKWLIALIIIVCAVCFYTSSWVEFDSDLKNIGYNEPKVLRSNALYKEKINRGFLSMYYAATDSVLDSALIYSKKVAHVCDSLQQIGVVEHYSNVSALLLTENEQQMRIDAWKNYWTAEKVADVRQKVAIAAAKNDIDASVFDPFFTLATMDYEPASLYESGAIPESLLSNFVEEVDGKYMVFTSVLLPESEKQDVSDAIADEAHTVVIDPFYYTNDMVRIVNDDFNVVLYISSIFVFIVLLISFKSLSRALLAFMPMFLSWYVVQGIMGIFGIQFNLINIIISSFIFGVGVDYSIFVMDGLLANTRRNDLQLLTYHKTAIFFSAFTLIVVVTSLLFATHPALKSVGVSTLIGMTATVLITYTLQPALFRLLMRTPFFSTKFGRKLRFRKPKEK